MSTYDAGNQELRPSNSFSFRNQLLAPKPIKRHSTIILRQYNERFDMQYENVNPFGQTIKCEKKEKMAKSNEDETFGDFEKDLKDQVDESCFRAEIFSILNGENEGLNLRASMPPLRVTNPFIRNLESHENREKAQKDDEDLHMCRHSQIFSNNGLAA